MKTEDRLSNQMSSPSPAKHAYKFCTLLIATAATAGGPPVEFEDVSDLIDFPVSSFTVGGNAQVGAAWLDYNNDGWLDLFLVNGCNQDNGLFRNNGDGTFSDVSAQAGVTHGLGCNGVIAADIDNDGFQDLFLTGEGGYQGSCARPVALYHNNGDGTFDDITASSGLVGPSTQFSAAMADINNDGFLDLFITGSGPQDGNGPPNKLFLNTGALTFTDISAGSGVDTDRGACAAFFSDVNDDGLIDLIVANCVPFFPSQPNELFINNGDLTFTDVAVQAGLAATGYWMGVGPGDYDNDGDIDIFVTNLGAGFSLWHALYRNNGDGTYTDVGLQAGVGAFEFGWGATMTDFDNDGYADIFFAGACPAFVIGPGFGNPGTMLFNRGDGTFENHTADMPTNLASRSTSGVAVGDYDNDGFPDIVVAADAIGADPGGPTIFRNLGNANAWLTVKLQGTTSNRDAVGARVRVTANGMTQTKEIYAGMSFLSQDSFWLTFGLGSAKIAELVEVRWPSGLVETITNVAARQAITLIEGQNSADGDPNGDGDVDLFDFASFVNCVTGPAGEKIPQECTTFDFDFDNDVDMTDFYNLLLLYTGDCGVTVTSQPADTTVCLGAKASFAIQATGVDLIYQWHHGGDPIAGATEPVLILENVQKPDQGLYFAAVTAGCAQRQSDLAELSLFDPPLITVQPVSQTVCPGDSVVFAVEAQGGEPLQYQWQRNGLNIPGANGQEYFIESVEQQDFATYTCVVTDGCQQESTSDPADLTEFPDASISGQPEGGQFCTGENVFLFVSTVHVETYQWLKDGKEIPGATEFFLSLLDVSPDDTGTYEVIVFGMCNSLVSDPVFVEIIDCETP